MNRMQIGMVLALNYLGIPVNVDNYQRIADAVYECEQAGVHVSPSPVFFDERRGYAISKKSHESGGNPSWNLLDDVEEVSREMAQGLDDSVSWTLDPSSLRKLEELREKLKSSF